ncbi:hypothetical protein BDZ94DRAFT_280837 [Collybia nuda]|uniref:Uncharacterized protein n=1 Tax=Collybia nuda TaxID=64659 RepID=A0A9P5YDQ0_9AGAR|nr:hypothetical protein BDZ94DRAFT_280837 [Collybia nuda]
MSCLCKKLEAYGDRWQFMEEILIFNCGTRSFTSSDRLSRKNTRHLLRQLFLHLRGIFYLLYTPWIHVLESSHATGTTPESHLDGYMYIRRGLSENQVDCFGLYSGFL